MLRIAMAAHSNGIHELRLSPAPEMFQSTETAVAEVRRVVNNKLCRPVRSYKDLAIGFVADVTIVVGYIPSTNCQIRAPNKRMSSN